MSHGVRMERLTRIIDPVEPPYTNPNGVADKDITEREARLWLLSQASRAVGGRVHFDTAIERWVVAGTNLTDARCENETCRKIFHPARISARYCSAVCRQRAQRARSVTLTGRLVSE